MKSRILVAVVGVPILVYVALWGHPVLLMAALAVLAGIGGAELQRCVGGIKNSTLVVLSALFPLLTVLAYFALPQALIRLVFCLETVVLFAYAIVKAGAVKFDQLMATLFGGILIGYSFSAFLRILNSGIHRAYLLLPFILSFACDTFAYFAGRTFGKHKLAPKVSPHKTIEGSIGGLLGNLLCGLLFAFVMDRYLNAGISYGAMAILALLCGVVAQIGDLSFSLIKREYGIKDYGHLFLEHGGVLDRFDSVLFVTPMVELVLNFVN